MTVISNAGPIIALARINKLGILRGYYKKIYIPTEAYSELVIKGKGKPGAEEIENSKWVLRKSVKDTRAVDILCLELDRGESESIILAQEMKADLILLDDSIAREIAKSLGLGVIGSIGILVKAKKDGKIERLEPVLDELRTHDIWIGNDLYKEALILAGEKK